MRLRIRSILVPLVAVTFFAGSCDDEGPVNVVVDPPPNLSGQYMLESFTQGGFTLFQPEVGGEFTLTQTAVAGGEASGTFSVDITVPDGLGGVVPEAPLRVRGRDQLHMPPARMDQGPWAVGHGLSTAGTRARARAPLEGRAAPRPGGRPMWS